MSGRQRVISFAGGTVTIEHSGARAAAIVDFLCRWMPTGDATLPSSLYRVAQSHAKHLALYKGEELVYEGESEAILAELLLGETCRQLAEQSQGGLLFHAAGLAWHGQGILVPGAPGAGKTTLSAWLTLRGLDYLTDELVFVPHQSVRLHALTRPLNLKKEARQALQNYFDFNAHAAHILSSSQADLAPPTLLRAANTLCQPPLRLILFPHYQPDSTGALRALSKAQAGLFLMQCLINARNLPGHGLAEIARLAQAAPAYTLSYASFDQLGPVEALLSGLADCDILAPVDNA